MSADIVAPEVRSRMMAGIRSRNTKPEIYVRSRVHRAGLRFRLHSPDLPGKPDLVLRRHRAVVFVHGCFWHRHPGCKHAYTPKSNARFWLRKLEGNAARDVLNQAALRAHGWRVFTVWECQMDRGVDFVITSLLGIPAEGSLPDARSPEARRTHPHRTSR